VVIVVIIAVSIAKVLVVDNKTVHGAVQDEVPMDQDKACMVLEGLGGINL
jgi:hypothetical protein